MNKYARIVGIAAAIIIGGSLSAYAIMQSDIELEPPTTEEIKDTVPEITEEEMKFGQLEKEEGAYQNPP